MSFRPPLFVYPAILAGTFVLGYVLPRGALVTSRSTPNSGKVSGEQRANMSSGQESPAALEQARSVASANVKSNQPISPATVDDVFRALSASTYGKRAYLVGEAINRLDATQLQEVLGQIESVARFDQWHILPRAIDRLMDLDPEAALTWMEANAGTFREGSSTYRAALGMVAKKAPDRLREIYERLPPTDRRNAFAQAIVEELTARDPAQALAFLKTIPAGPAKDEAMLGYATGAAAADPESAISTALTWKLGAARTAVLTRAFLTMAKGSASQALIGLDQIKQAYEKGRILGFLAANARSDDLPKLAEYYARAIQEDPSVGQYFGSVARLAEGLANGNPERAVAFSLSLTGDQREQALSKSLSIWGWKEPQAALDWVAKNAPPPERDGQFQTVLDVWLSRDFSSAREWVAQIPVGAQRDLATRRIVSLYASQGEDANAMKWLEQLPAPQQSQLAQDLAGSLAWRNAPVAAKWLSHLEPDQQSAPLFGRVAREWAESDFRGAAGWISSLPAGPARDSAVANYATEVSMLDPASAAEWAATTTDEMARFSVIGDVLTKWAGRDAGAAARWLDQTAALTPARKQHLRKYLP